MAVETFIQDIKVNILDGTIALKEKVFNILIMGSGAAAIAHEIITQPSELLAFGYLTTDIEFKKASAIFSQQPSPATIIVARKITSDSYTVALTALKLLTDDFWAITIDSTSPSDLFEVEAFAGANKKFFYGLSNSITIGVGRNQRRGAYMVHDQLSTAGFAEISSSGDPILGSDVPALPDDTYDLDVIVDIENPGAPYQLAVALLAVDDWDGIAAKIQTSLQAASSTAPTVVILKGKIKITSATTGDDSGITISEGTAGNTPLLGFIDLNVANITTVLDTPVPGFDIHPESAHLGRKLGKDPQLQWKWKGLNGIPAVKFNQTQLQTIRTNKTNTVTTQSGQIFTNGGFVSSGSYIDITYSIDFVEDQLIVAILGALLRNESVPLTDNGINIIEGVMRATFDDLGNLGIIAGLNANSSDEDRDKSDGGVFIYKLVMPKRSDIPVNDRTNRILSQITFSYTVAGAVDEVEVEGKIEA